MPASAASRRTVARVIPSGHDAVVGVASVPPAAREAPRSQPPANTMKTCVALVSAMKPRWSSITASSAPATFASILARIDGSRLLWWIFGSRQSGAGRRTLAVISVMPAASYTGSLNSASTISVGPATFSRGSMPEVTLTPRVSVSRMCTPSRIPLAARVRRISSTISSSGGTESNASACAERRSLSRCSPSAKIRPRVSRSPSHTASPPWTAESNGLTPAWSRCESLPPTLTIRSRLRSSNFCSMHSLLESAAYVRDEYLVLPELLVVGQALVKQRLERRVQAGGGARLGGWHRDEAGRAAHAVVPVRRPHAIGVARARRPAEHRGGKRHAEGGAQGAQRRLRRGQQVRGIEHRPAELREDRGLLPQAEVVQGRRRTDPRVGGEQRARVPDQEGVPQRRQRRPVHRGQEVMRHVLLVVDRDARRQRVFGEPAQHDPPVGGLTGDHLVPARMVQARRGEIEGVQRLVDDGRVRPVLPGAHQRRRDGPRPGPHRDPGHVGVQKTTTLRSTSPRSILV